MDPNCSTSDIGGPGSKTSIRYEDLKIKSDIADVDTVHFISPASTVRTEHEGDLYSYFAGIQQRELIHVEPTVSTVSCEESQMQRMITIVRPEAMLYKDVVIRTIVETGIDIIASRVLHLTPEQVSELYSQHYGSPGFPHLVISMCSEPVLVMALSGISVIEKFKCLIGPNNTLQEEWFFPHSMKIRFGIQPPMEDALHASNNLLESNKENRFFFPDSYLEPLISERPKVEDYCDLYYRETLVNALTELVRVKPVEPIIYLAEWLLLNNPYQPRFPYGTAMAPT